MTTYGAVTSFRPGMLEPPAIVEVWLGEWLVVELE